MGTFVINMRGQSSVEIVLIIGAFVVLVSAFAAAYQEQFIKTIGLSAARFAAIYDSAAHINYPCVYSMPEHVYFVDDRTIEVEYESYSFSEFFPCTHGDISSVVSDIYGGFNIQ